MKRAEFDTDRIQVNICIWIAEKFLPEKLEEDEVKKIVLIAIQELNATTMSDMSKVMKVVIEKTKGS